MIYCEYCGHIITDGQNYCSSCGAPVTASQIEQEEASAVASSAANATVEQGSGDYSLILVSLGSCTQAAASDLLEDTLGYTQSESEELFSMLPAQAAQMLTQNQASYLAQAMTEYGMDVSVKNGSGYISMDDLGDTGQSVFDSDGSFLSKVAGVIGLISGWNRMRKFRKLQNSWDYNRLFARKTYRPAPPKHIRRRLSDPTPNLLHQGRPSAPSPVQNRTPRPAKRDHDMHSNAPQHRSPSSSHSERRPGARQMRGGHPDGPGRR